MLLSDIYSPLFFWIHQVNSFFLFCGFYGNNTTTQLGLIQPCRSQSLSNSWTQHVSHRKKRAPANLDETPIKLLFDPLFISELSATLTKERAAWNKSITCSSLVFWFFFFQLCTFFAWYKSALLQSFFRVYWSRSTFKCVTGRKAQYSPNVFTVTLATGSNSPSCHHFPFGSRSSVSVSHKANQIIEPAFGVISCKLVFTRFFQNRAIL